MAACAQPMTLFERPRPLHWVLIALMTCLVACSKPSPKPEPAASSVKSAGFEVLELRYQGSVGAVVFPELAEDLGYLAPVKLKYIGNTISGPQDIQTVVTGDTDFGGAFNGAIINLIAARAPIKAVVGNYGVDSQTWGGYFVLDSSPIKSARDLIGKKVSVNTFGAHSEFVLREYLKRGGLSKAEADQVELLVVPPVSSEQALRGGQVDVATLGGILRDKALERGGLRKLFSDFDLFGEFTAGTYVLRTDFIQKNPNTSRQFVQAVARAIEWARVTPREEVVARFSQILAKRHRPEDANPIKYWRSTGIAARGGYIRPQEFQIWIDWLINNGQLKESQVSLSQLYTNEFSPFPDGS